MSKSTKKILSVFLSFALAFWGMILATPLTVQAADPLEVDLADGSITITTSDTYTQNGQPGGTFDPTDGLKITQSGSGTTANTITVESGVTVKITLAGVNISTSACAFELKSGANVTLTLEGDNKLKSGNNRAGLQAPDGTALTIGGTGSLDAQGGGSVGGAGIGGGVGETAGNITIDSGDIKATGGNNENYGGGGAGIGGGGASSDSGNAGGGGVITINGGSVDATGGTIGGIGGGAGIGGGGAFDGAAGNSGTITINGGTVNATGLDNGAGIGGGGGKTPGNGNTIAIDEDAVVSVKADSSKGNAIGGGCDSFGAVNYAAAVTNAGTLTIETGTRLEINGGVIITNTATGRLVNNGTIRIYDAGSQLINDGTLVNNGTIRNTAGTFENNGTILNNGNITNPGNITGSGGPPEITWSGLAANGTTGTVDTTELTLTFSANPTTLAESDVAVTGATKGALQGSGITRTLAISDITVAEGQSVTVDIANPAGFAISPSSRDVAIHRASAPVAPAITTTALPGGTVGTYYSQALTATGDAPITWTLDGGDLPDNLTLSTDGIISGTPTADGTFDFTVKASNSVGDNTQALSIVIAPATQAPTITTTSLPGGTVGTPYSQTLAAAGDAPITWTLDGGDLPDGLNLTSDGVISGNPTADGTFDFTVKASNSVGDDTQALSIVIAPDISTPTGTPSVTSADPINLDLNGVTTAHISVSLGQSGDVLANAANISVTSGNAVTVSPETLTSDRNVTVTAVNVGTATISVTFSGGDVTDTTYDKDITVNVTNSYVPPIQATHTITATAGTGGSITPSGSVTVNDCGRQSFTITASSGYHISGVTVDGVNQGAIGSYTFINVTGNHTIHAAFAVNSSGSSSSGSSSGSDSSDRRNDSTTSVAAPTTVIRQEALDAFNKALANLTPGQTTVTVRFVNRQSISAPVLKALADAANKAGVTVIIHADTVSDGAVQTRLYIDPTNAIKDISLTAFADSPDAVNTMNRFKRWFKNKLAAVATGQQGDFGMAVNIAVKVDSAEFDTKNLYFYSYDKGTNTYRRIEKPAYWIDKNGYLHFTTELAGDIIINEGQLERK